MKLKPASRLIARAVAAAIAVSVAGGAAAAEPPADLQATKVAVACKYKTTPGARAPGNAKSVYKAGASEAVLSHLVTAPAVKPSVAGNLSLAKKHCMTTLVDSAGRPIQLRGMSTHGLQWAGGILNDNAFKTLAHDWGSNLIRLALYVGEEGYATKPELLQSVFKGIDLAIANDMYVLVDWHVLSPGDPTADVYKGAMEFFRAVSTRYPNNKHIIYELANEPNPGHQPGISNDRKGWLKVKAYAEPIIRMLRKAGNNNIIVVGTPNWSQRPDLAIADPIHDANTMYTVHFYTGTHLPSNKASDRKNVMSNARAALEAGVAVFATEWGTSEASGNNGPFFREADIWLDFLNKHNISWANWSLGNGNETSAALTPYVAGKSTATLFDPGSDLEWSPKELSLSGEYVRHRIKGVPHVAYDRTRFSETIAHFDGNGVDGWVIQADSPIKTVKLSNEDGMLKLSGMRASADTSTGNYWNNVRISTDGLKSESDLAGAKVMTMDVVVASPTSVSVAAIPRSLSHQWANPAAAVVLKPSDFAVQANGKYKAVMSVDLAHSPNFKLISEGADAKASVLTDLVLFVGAHGTDAIWLDNISFSGNRSATGRVVNHSPPGAPAVPSTFEDGTRQGWTWDGTSGVNSALMVADVKGSKALSFDVKYPDVKPEDTWASAPRLVLEVGPLTRGTSNKLLLDFYLKPERATRGSLHLKVSFSPANLGYWAQASEFITVDFAQLKAGPKMPDGTYHYKASFDLTKIEEGKLVAADTPLNRINIIVNDVNSDFAGKMFVDNIRFAP